ncbi:MAG: metallophosphoesterase [Stellaceae bacterium]
MKIAVMSDLHLEFDADILGAESRVRSPRRMLDFYFHPPQPSADVIVLAGDIHSGAQGVDWAASSFTQPVVLIAGNHEAYGRELFRVIAYSRQKAEAMNPRVNFLERNTWHFTSPTGVSARFIGATLWTDFQFYGCAEKSMEVAQERLEDFRVIKLERGLKLRPLHPSDTVRLYHASVKFLEDELKQAFDGITVVVTHHAPSSRSIASAFQDSPLNPAFVSNLDHLIETYQPSLWIHGHMHTSFDYQIGRTRVICNPRGYFPDQLNPDFDPTLVVEVVDEAPRHTDSRRASEPAKPRSITVISRAINRLCSLHDRNRGVVDTVACGASAIPALRRILFRREPSGLYEARRRAIEALALLGAYDAIMEFLRVPRESADPVERTGDEAVMNTAARSLTKFRESRVFPLLRSVAERRNLSGVIEALGEFRRLEALPYLIAGLGEDFTRYDAENSIRKLGIAARPALLQAATDHRPSLEHETVSSRRKRRSALKLLVEIGAAEAADGTLSQLVRDRDAHVAVLACRLCLTPNRTTLRTLAVRRLIELLPSGEPLLDDEIEDHLVVAFAQVKGEIEEGLEYCRRHPTTGALPILQRVKARGEGPSARR